MQDINMQIERLEDTVDSLHNKSESILGSSDPITMDAIKILVYLQGLKFDYAESIRVEETKENE